MKLPSIIELSPTNCLDLDESWVVENFHGRTKSQVIELLEENDLYYSDAFVHMGDKGFLFYFGSSANCVKAFCRNQGIRNSAAFLDLLTQVALPDRSHPPKLLTVNGLHE